MVRLAGGHDRPPVPRHPPRQGPLLQARGSGRGGAPGHRRRGHQGHLRPAQGHARLLPRHVPAEVLRRGRLGVVGLGDLRPQGRPAQEDLHAGAAAGHRGPRAPAPDRVADGGRLLRNLGKPSGRLLRHERSGALAGGLLRLLRPRASPTCSASAAPHLLPAAPTGPGRRGSGPRCPTAPPCSPCATATA